MLEIKSVNYTLLLCNNEFYRCKTMRPCYKHMIDTLKDHDEASCIEDASIGASTVSNFHGNLCLVFA